MSGNNVTITCPKCQTANILRVKGMTIALTCQSCGIYFRTLPWDKGTVEFFHSEHQLLPIGAKGRIDGFLYEVMGFVVKEETKYHYRWREYLVFNPYRGYAFVSEYNGHWNFVWPLEIDPKGDAADDFDFENSRYLLYQKYAAKVVHAKGEFFFDVFDIAESTMNYEYIAPPFLLALEKSGDSVLWCKGEYFKPNEIAEAFSIPPSEMPSRSGVGYTQPFNASFSDKALLWLTTVLVLTTLALHLIINSSAEDKSVFQAYYKQSELKDQKVIVTESFILTGGTKSLEVYLYAPVENDWFFSEFALVNDNDGTEYNFTKEVEYYFGTDGGESWTEGSKNAEAFLSSIPEGKYHLNIYPQFSGVNEGFSIEVLRDVPMQSNFFVTTIALLAYPAFFFVRKRIREQRRWSDSDYSPYD